ncbi:ATPase [Chloroflexia bacterium SDU3-3]|nr:ATPase [Chloroflexia bacterium SDU3-3]
MRPTNRLCSRIALTLSLILTLGSGFVAQRSSVQAQSITSPRTVFVQLFEWKWTDIAKECETYLGPQGFSAVQISPPNEHAIIQSNGTYPWWERYQPVSYSLAKSRSGTLAEFQDMVTRCHNVGVDIYADAVINHMTAGGGTGFDGTYYHGSNGSAYSKYTYPGTYSEQDFHSCHSNISNYNDAGNVQNCELSGLSDLNTSSSYVRSTIANYMIALANMGVRGFRIDAAKHMSAADVAAIVSQVNAAVEPDPYFFLEVIGSTGEAVQPSDYYSVGGGSADITEFQYEYKLSNKFLNTSYSGGYEKISELKTFGETWGFMASDKAVVFTSNHDTQRSSSNPVITYHNGSLNDLSNIFMLAWPFGYPVIMSSYAFDRSTGAGTDAGPPSDANGNTLSIYPSGSSTPNCFSQTVGSGWVCEHRWRTIGNMVPFRNYTSGAAVANWWDNGNNQIAFSRGTLGFVAINRESTPLTRTFTTGLPAGSYCDVIHYDFATSAGTCTGTGITVSASGTASITVPAMSAVALYGGAKIGATTPTATPATTPTATPTPASAIATSFGVNATTVWGQNVYVVGNVAALGAWNTSSAILLSSASYPVWTGTVSLPPSTAIEYKYIKKDSAGNVTWESGANRAFTTPASGTVSRTAETWK